jgi:glycosyltransferase involved in cell wall biosynthesis
MRVLHVIPSVSERSGGPGMAIVPMCRALQAQGVEVVLVATEAGLRGGVDTRESARAVDHEGVPAIFFPSQLGESFKYSRPLALWLNANVQWFDVAHIHAVFNHASVAAARECRKARVPYVVRPLGTLDPWSMKQKPIRKRVFWSILGKTMLSGAAAVHYTSQTEQTATEALLGVNHGQVIPLGIDVDDSSTNDTHRDPYVLVMSRLHPKKGLDVLIDAFTALTRLPEFNQWRLVIAGDGPADYLALLKGKAAAAQDRVEFSGWISGARKEEMLRHASLLALPSFQENFGLCVMEALARSVPVLISPQVNLAEEIEAANAGWIAPVEAAPLSSILANALSDADELSRRGRAGKLLSQNYSWERVATSLAGLYTEITNDSTGVHRV